MIERLLAADAAFERDDAGTAERLFRQVAEADPRNAIALVGLARVAARRGATSEARDLLERALAIDPDEAAARRLTVELEAVPTVAAPPVRMAEPAPVGPRGLLAWLARILRRG